MSSSITSAGRKADARRTQAHAADETCESGFAVVITLLFLILAGITIFHHELWRDEVQAWMIAVRSTSLPNLYANLRYDGHPGLWYLLLYAASRFSHNPVWMQVVHLSLATGAVYVFARFAPFSRLPKALFIFGYFPFYEYAVISRNYALGTLLITSAAVLFPDRKRRLIPLCIILGLLANASTYALMISLAFSLSLAVALFLDSRAGKDSRVAGWKMAVGATILLFAFGIAVFTMMPASDHGLYVTWDTELDPGRLVDAVGTFGIGYGLVPDVFTQWHSLANSIPLRAAQALLGGLLVAFWVCCFARKPMILLMYLAASLPILMFAYLKHPGSPRHHGHLFLILIVCLWLSTYYKERPLRWRLGEICSSVCSRWSNAVVVFLLVLHFACGVVACAMDVALPFSMSRATAEYIQSKHLENMLIVGDRDSPASAVTGYLDRDMYYPTQGDFGSYCIFNKKRMHIITKPELFRCVGELMSRHHQDILLVLSYPLADNDCRTHDMRFLKHTSGSIVWYEKYWLYTAKYTK